MQTQVCLVPKPTRGLPWCVCVQSLTYQVAKQVLKCRKVQAKCYEGAPGKFLRTNINT